MKNIFIRFLVFVGMIAPFQLLAQITDFNLSNYKLPDYKRHSLDFNFDLFANSNFSSFNLDFDPYSNDKAMRISNSLNASYQLVNNTAKLQQSLSLNLNLQSSLSSSKREILNPVVTNSFDYSPRLYINSINRFYFNNKSFLEINPYLLNDYYYRSYSSEQENANDYKSKGKINNFSTRLPLKYGIGRIEPVQDARQAAYILESLMEQNNLAREITENDIFQLAQKISSVKNKRYFDSRLRKIDELKTIDAFLDSTKILSKHTIEYFTTFNDLWEYGDRISRYTGTRLAFVFLPGYYISNNNLEIDDVLETERTRAMYYHTGIEFKYEKPINLKWQNTIDFSGLYGVYSSKNEISEGNPAEINYVLPSIQFELAQKIGFYPNTRTEFTFSYSFLYYKLYNKTDVNQEISSIDNSGLYAVSGLSINYYFSPQLRMNLHYGLEFSFRNSKEVNNLSTNSLDRNLILANNNYLYLLTGDQERKEFDQLLMLSFVYSLF